MVLLEGREGHSVAGSRFGLQLGKSGFLGVWLPRPSLTLPQGQLSPHPMTEGVSLGPPAGLPPPRPAPAGGPEPQCPGPCKAPLGSRGSCTRLEGGGGTARAEKKQNKNPPPTHTLGLLICPTACCNRLLGAVEKCDGTDSHQARSVRASRTGLVPAPGGRENLAVGHCLLPARPGSSCVRPGKGDFGKVPALAPDL